MSMGSAAANQRCREVAA